MAEAARQPLLCDLIPGLDTDRLLPQGQGRAGHSPAPVRIQHPRLCRLSRGVPSHACSSTFLVCPSRSGPGALPTTVTHPAKGHLAGRIKGKGQLLHRRFLFAGQDLQPHPAVAGSLSGFLDPDFSLLFAIGDGKAVLQPGILLHCSRAKTGQEGLKAQPRHALIGLRCIQVFDLGILIGEPDPAVDADRGQGLAHLGHIVMLAQRLLRSGRLDLLQMGIGVLDAPVGGDDRRGRLLPDGRHTGDIVRGVAHQRLHIDILHRGHLILPLDILRIVIVNLRIPPAGLRDADLDLLV